MANNPYVNKVELADGTSLIDISDSTVTADKILQGYTAYGADGSKLTGTATSGTNGVVYITDTIDEHGGTIRNIVTDEDATITDTLDSHGGTVRSITGAEVYLQSASVQPTESAQTVTPTGDYYALGAVNVGAIPSDYIGSAIEQRDSSDLTVSGATVSVPAGVYASSASKTVASGTEGTPTATKGTVSNHSVSVTPSVTNSAGYITGGTKTGTAVSVSASELVSGTKSINANGTGIDVANYASVDVSVPSDAPTLQTKTYTVDSAGTETITADSGYDGLSSVSVSVPEGGLMNAIGGDAVNPTIDVDSSGLVAAYQQEYVPVTPIYRSGWLDSSAEAFVFVYGSSEYQLPTQSATAITPTESSQTAVAKGKWTTGAVTVNPIPSQYIIPSGTYNVTSSGTKDVTSYASASVPSGTEGTPTATKGAVSNHSISVTPSVTNTTGYITGSTKTGTAVTVTASELASGNKAITQNGTGIDVVGYSTVSVDVQGGGGGDSWNWMGKNPTKVATCLNEKNYLKDTGFATWTPSTTIATISPQTALTTQTVDFTNYDYIVLYRFHTHFEYTSEGNNRISDYYNEDAFSAFGYSSDLTNITADTINSCSTFSLDQSYGFFYKYSSDNSIYTTQSGYGVYASTSKTPPSVSSSGSITPNAPAISARCNNTYFSTASAEVVNQNTSYYEQTIELWRVDRGTTPSGARKADIRDMWLNGF